MLTASYSIDGVSITEEELKRLQIKRRDYIDYVESIKKTINKKHKNMKNFPQNTKASKVC